MAVLNCFIFLPDYMVASERYRKQGREALMIAKVQQSYQVVLTSHTLFYEFFSFFDDEVTDFKVSIFGSKVQGCVSFAVREAN